MTACTHLDSLALLVLHLLLQSHDRLPLRLDLELLRPSGRQSFRCRGDLHGGSKVQYGNDTATTRGETRVAAETAESLAVSKKNDARPVSFLSTTLTSAVLAHLSNQCRPTKPRLLYIKLHRSTAPDLNKPIHRRTKKNKCKISHVESSKLVMDYLLCEDFL